MKGSEKSFSKNLVELCNQCFPELQLWKSYVYVFLCITPISILGDVTWVPMAFITVERSGDCLVKGPGSSLGRLAWGDLG